MSNQPKMKAGYVIEEPNENSSPEERQAFSGVNDVFKDLPANHFGVFNARTQEVIDLGTVGDAMGSAVFEEDQIGNLEDGVSHKVKFKSVIDMINSSPNVNQGLNLRSELPVGYGYRFQYDTVPEELEDISQKLPTISIPYWNLWSRYVNYDHILRQSFHSTLAMGNVWTEKIYDRSGMNRKGWGVRAMKVLSPDLMHNVIDDKGNILFFAQTLIDTERRFGDNFAILYRDWGKYKDDLRERHDGFNPDRHVVYLPRHKVMYWNYNAYYDDTVYGFGAGVPLFSYTKSKIGIQKRVLRMIDNSSSSMLVFKYGNENYMVAGKGAKGIFNKIKTQRSLKYVLLPWYFDVEEKELGKNLPNAEPYLRYFAEEEMNGIGLPPVITGRGGSAEGATIQQEFLVRQLMFMQRIIRNEHARQLFPECVVGDPTQSSVVIGTQTVDEVIAELEKDAEIRNLSVVKYPYLAPSVFAHVPTLAWNTMESVSDRRLRHEVYAKYGGLSEEEFRAELDYPGTVADEDQNITLRIELEKLAIERLKLENQLEIAKIQAKATAQSKTPTPSSKSE